MYSFTPILLTHDIRNFTPTYTAGGGLLHYDMKAQGLMYQKIEDALGNINQSSFYGYPHLAHPNDHFQITPFEAVFSWDRVNTVHIPSGEARWNDNLSSIPCSGNDKHDRWEQIDSPVRAEMRHFILSEADAFTTYIQNRRYGWNANPNSIYKADIVSKHKIFAGENVTQRTDFKEVEIAENADIRFIACEGITLKPGVHIKAGATFHAKIDPQVCGYCTSNKPIQHEERHPYTIDEGNVREINEVYFETALFKLYPNPSSTKATIELMKDDVNSFHYEVMDMSGKLIESGAVAGKTKHLSLPQGMYLVNVKTDESWESKKLVVY